MRRLLSAAVWTGIAGDGQWNTAANWQAGTVPAPGQDVQFPANSSRVQVFLGNDVEVGDAEFDGSYIVENNTITLDGNITVTGSFVEFGSNVVLTHNTTMNVGDSDVLEILPISDNGNGYGLTKEGAGELGLGGQHPDTFSGPSEVIAGTVGVVVPNQSVFTVDAGATLEGNSSVGGIIGNGGAISASNGPGIGMLRSAGDVTLGAGSTVLASVQSVSGFNQYSYLTAHGPSLDITGASFGVNYLHGRVSQYWRELYDHLQSNGKPRRRYIRRRAAGRLRYGRRRDLPDQLHRRPRREDVTATVTAIAARWDGNAGDNLWSDPPIGTRAMSRPAARMSRSKIPVSPKHRSTSIFRSTSIPSRCKTRPSPAMP